MDQHRLNVGYGENKSVLSRNHRTRPKRTAAWRAGSRKMIGGRGKGSYLMLLKTEKDSLAREEHREGESKSPM